MPAWKSVMSTPHNAPEAQKQGFCLGAVGGIGRVDPGICPPKGSPRSSGLASLSYTSTDDQDG
jgi:hypothetical protein